VPSERPCATQRHRFGGVQAPWTVERRAGCSSVPAGSWYCAMGDAATHGTCAACAARARPWRRAFTPHDGPAPQARTSPPRAAHALRSVPIAGGEVELALLCAGGQGTLPASGRARCARCARRDRSGATLGSAGPPRAARLARRVPLRSQAVRSSWPCCAPLRRARCRLRAGRAARVVLAEAARVPSWAEPRPCVSPRRRVADLHERVRTFTLTLTLTLPLTP